MKDTINRCAPVATEHGELQLTKSSVIITSGEGVAQPKSSAGGIPSCAFWTFAARAGRSPPMIPAKPITLILCSLIVVVARILASGGRQDQISLGSAIRQLRELRGLSQETLAERAGLHRNDVGGVECGERNVALENIVKLAKALSVPIRELFDTLP